MPRVKGERRLEILKALAQMLEQPKWGKITTAALAEKLDVSEAALYRHFASKAQMYEGLIEFIESSVFTLANKIAGDEPDGRRQADKLLEMLLAFAEKNPGMVRVMTGDALVGEHERLQARMNQFYDRFESTLKQALCAHCGRRRPESVRRRGQCARRHAGALRDRLPAPVREVRLHEETQRKLRRAAALPRALVQNGILGPGARAGLVSAGGLMLPPSSSHSWLAAACSCLGVNSSDGPDGLPPGIMARNDSSHCA